MHALNIKYTNNQKDKCGPRVLVLDIVRYLAERQVFSRERDGGCGFRCVSWVRGTRVWRLALPLCSCVSLGESLNPLKPSANGGEKRVRLRGCEGNEVSGCRGTLARHGKCLGAKCPITSIYKTLRWRAGHHLKKKSPGCFLHSWLLHTSYSS